MCSRDSFRCQPNRWHLLGTMGKEWMIQLVQDDGDDDDDGDYGQAPASTQGYSTARLLNLLPYLLKIEKPLLAGVCLWW